MKFHDYTTWADKWRRTFPAGLSDLAIVREIQAKQDTRSFPIPGFPNTSRNDMQFAGRIQLNYQKAGRPYYKVWPQIGAALQAVSLDVPCEAMGMPYAAFVVRFPVGEQVLIVDSRPVGTLMVSVDGLEYDFHKRVPSDAIDTLSVSATSSDGGVDCDFRISIGRHQGRTIQQCMDDYSHWNTHTDQAGVKVMFSVAVSVALFGIDRHELVLPDVRRLRVIKRRGAKRQKVLEGGAAEESQGWKLGSELDLPRPLVRYIGDGDRCRRALREGHIRAGHLRMQVCGKGAKQRKLIFIAPTVVRPDLPLQQFRRGFRLGRVLNGT